MKILLLLLSLTVFASATYPADEQNGMRKKQLLAHFKSACNALELPPKEVIHLTVAEVEKRAWPSQQEGSVVLLKKLLQQPEIQSFQADMQTLAQENPHDPDVQILISDKASRRNELSRKLHELRYKNQLEVGRVKRPTK